MIIKTIPNEFLKSKFAAPFDVHAVMQLTILIVVLVANNIIWFELGGRPLHWDAAIHLSESLNADRIGQDTSASIMKQALNISWYYPPFVSYASIAVYRLLGESEFSGLQVMTLFLVILVISVYGIGSRLYGSRAGLLSACLVGACPIVMEYSRTFMLDMPLAAMVTLSIYLLIRTDSFMKRMPSLLLGLTIGCGMLTKWTFPLFVLFPVGYIAIKTFKRTAQRRYQLTSFVVAVVIGLIIAMPWYLVHAIQIFSSRGGELARGGLSLPESMLYYLRIIPAQSSWLLTFMFILGIPACMFLHRFSQPVLWLWFLGGYILVSLISFKEPRFSISLLPPLFIMTSAGLVSWMQRAIVSLKVEKALMMILVGVPLVQYMIISYVPLQSSLAKFVSQPLLSISIMPVDGPMRADWRQNSIVNLIEQERKKENKSRVVVRVIPDYVYYNNATLAYAAKLQRFPIVVAGTTGFPLFTDYILLKTGDAGVDSRDREREEITRTVLSETSGLNTMYRPVQQWELPDGSEGILLHVDPQPINGVSDTVVLRKMPALASQFVIRYVKPVQGYRLEVQGSDSAQTIRGRFKELKITANAAEFGDFTFNPIGILVKNIEVVITNVQVDPKKLILEDTLWMTSIGGLSVRRFDIAASDLGRYAEESSNGKIKIESLSVRNGIIHIEGRLEDLGTSFRLDVRLKSVGHENIEFSFEEAQIGILPVPALLLNIVTSPFNPVITGLDVLSEVTIGELTLEDDQIRIGH